MMRTVNVAIVAAMLLFGAACSDNGTGSDGMGRISVEAFDAPPITDYEIQHVYLTVETVEAYSVEADEWDTLGTPNAVIDFLELVNGETSVVADTSIATGLYSQIRLKLGESDSIVVDGVAHALKIPSGTSSGVKLNVDFEVPDDGEISLYVDFDVAKSVTVTGNASGFILRPVFKAFTEQESGTISGTVKDASGAGVERALVTAVSGADSTNSFTDLSGGYKIIVPAGTYELSAGGLVGAQADTTYSAVEVGGEDKLTGYNFVLQ